MLSSVRRQAAVLVATVAVFSLGLSALGTSGASAQTTPGVTSNSVKLGLLADLTGPLASSFGGVAQGAQARSINRMPVEVSTAGRSSLQSVMISPTRTMP